MIDEFRQGLLYEFAGRPVFDFDFADADPDPDPEARAGAGAPEPGSLPERIEDWAWRLRPGLDEPDLRTGLDILVGALDPSRIRALISGSVHARFTQPPSEQTAALLAHADRLAGLEALFLGDITPEQCEVSWLYQEDPAPLLAAFPRLREFGLRGTTALSTIEPLEHDTLEELTFQGGGLSPAVVRAVGASRLPALTGLELYLGTRRYNGGAEPADLEAILAGNASFPRLRHLALRDAENADEIAAALAGAPIVAQLETLDLSLGALGDGGAAALLAGRPLTHLKRLDLHHHFLGDEMMRRVRAALPGVEVNLDEQETPDEVEEVVYGRYVAVAE